MKEYVAKVLAMLLTFLLFGCARCEPHYSVVGAAPDAAVVLNSCTGDLELRAFPHVPMDAEEVEK